MLSLYQNEFYKVILHFILCWTLREWLCALILLLMIDSDGKFLLPLLISGDPLSVTSQESLMSLIQEV